MFLGLDISLEQLLVISLSPIVLALVCIGGPILVSVLGLRITRKLIPANLLKEHHDVAGAMLGALGTIYGIFLAFIVATTWQYYSTTASNVDDEARCIGNLYTNAEAFTPPFRDAIQNNLRLYRDTLVNEEWKELAGGQSSSKAEKLLHGLSKEYMTYRPASPSEEAFYNESVHNLNMLKQLRMDRLADASSGLIPLLWIVLVMGAIATIGFTFLFATHSFYAQMIMTVLFAGVIALTLYTIVNLDFPFSGMVAIPPDALTRLDLSPMIP